MKISKESKVGVLVAIAIAILAIGYNFMKGEDIFTSSNEYYGKYKKIEGLFKSNPVLINGYKVGSVSSVQMSNETLELTVGVIVSEDIKIPKNSIMKIVNNDMIGSKAVEIIFGDSKEVAKNGDFFTAQQDQGIAQAVSGVLTPITQSVNSVLGNMDTAIAGVDLRGTLRDASLALRSFKETADKLNKLLDGKDAQITNILNDVEKKNDNFFYMVFINNGQIHYSHHDILEDIKLDDPLYFFDKSAGYQCPNRSDVLYHPGRNFCNDVARFD